jgi:DNA-binding SARP family transcriptional activator
LLYRCVDVAVQVGNRLDLSLLGAPAAEVDGEPLAVDTRKAIALLAYLAVEGGGHTRDSLAALLWPDYDGDRARAALRRTLSTLRAALGGGWVAAQRDTVWLDRAGVRSDVDEARRLTEEGSFEAAAALHRGAFLAGFGLRDSPAFDSWQSFRPER